jgi:tetratricopeptide (TPR) repeat protein
VSAGLASGHEWAGATPVAASAYARALAAYQSWHGDMDEPLALALREAPSFVMAHALQAYRLVCSRDPRRIRLARPLLERASGLRGSACERLHLAAIGAAAAGNYEQATAHLDDLLRQRPLDALALQVANTFDYYTGHAPRMLHRVEAVLPAWHRDMPGCHAVLATHAFALEEQGEYEHAEQAAREALALNPLDVRAHHVMAHVFEMTDRPDAGVRWMNAQVAAPGAGRLFTKHCWWHLALFHLTLGQTDRALALYDGFIRPGSAGEIADLIDAAALLWRLRLVGAEVGARATDLATAWARHIDDAFCTFNDLHAMLAFVGAQDVARAGQLEAALLDRQSLPTRYGATTQQLGLPACRALMAFGRGDFMLATTLLASLPALAHRLGGSHAQRDVLHLTLLQAIERIRRPHRPALSARPADRAAYRVLPVRVARLTNRASASAAGDSTPPLRRSSTKPRCTTGCTSGTTASIG